MRGHSRSFISFFSQKAVTLSFSLCSSLSLLSFLLSSSSSYSSFPSFSLPSRFSGFGRGKSSQGTMMTFPNTRNKTWLLYLLSRRLFFFLYYSILCLLLTHKVRDNCNPFIYYCFKNFSPLFSLFIHCALFFCIF